MPSVKLLLAIEVASVAVVHYLGDSADKAGLDFLNRRGTPGAREL